MSNKADFSDILKTSIGGGLSGAAAMTVQVTSLMWLRTTMNYQYRYGTTTNQAFKKLYSDGKIWRFYKGYTPALMIGPLSRFGDTMTNTYALNSLDKTNLPTSVKTMFGSVLAATWRVLLMPIDSVKTSMQVEGRKGLNLLSNKIKKTGPQVLFHGTGASMSATFIGHYPWFLTYNILDDKLPKYNDGIKKFARNGVIGFSAAVISDCCSNSLRVIKTTKQTHSTSLSYNDTIKLIVKEDGIKGLFGRGLKTRILTNGIQGVVFTVTWKYIQDIININNI